MGTQNGFVNRFPASQLFLEPRCIKQRIVDAYTDAQQGDDVQREDRHINALRHEENYPESHQNAATPDRSRQDRRYQRSKYQQQCERRNGERYRLAPFEVFLACQ